MGMICLNDFYIVEYIYKISLKKYIKKDIKRQKNKYINIIFYF